METQESKGDNPIVEGPIVEGAKAGIDTFLATDHKWGEGYSNGVKTSAMTRLGSKVFRLGEDSGWSVEREIRSYDGTSGAQIVTPRDGSSSFVTGHTTQGPAKYVAGYGQGAKVGRAGADHYFTDKNEKRARELIASLAVKTAVRAEEYGIEDAKKVA